MPRMAEVTDISKMFTFHNYFRFSPAIGIISKTGAGGGTYAHHDIAFSFANWVSTKSWRSVSFCQSFSLLLLLLLNELSWGDTEMLAEDGGEIGKRGEAYGIGHLGDIHLLLLQ